MSRQPPVSAPRYVPVPPRALTAGELQTMLEVADTLIPDGSAGPRPSAFEDYPMWLDRALAARRDAFEDVMVLVGELADCAASNLYDELKRLSGIPGSGFEVLSSILAGAYLSVSEVRRAIGYPGQAHRPPRFDDAAEQLMGGILDPVIERGPVHRRMDAAAVPSPVGN